MDRCERTDLLVGECDHCRKAAKATEEIVWSALYEGTCATCGVGFDKGRSVKWTADGGVQHSYHQ